jgi:predicted transcriptional regulator
MLRREYEMEFLSENRRALLSELFALGAATPIELAMKVARKYDEVTADLQELCTAGLVKVYPRASGYEREIYQLSEEGRFVVQQLNGAASNTK